MTGSDPAQIQTSDQTKLTRGLKSRHVELIAIGGAIGVGLFLGSAKAIQNAGPGLILGYAIGGLVIFFIMRALGELLLYRPVAGSFVVVPTSSSVPLPDSRRACPTGSRGS